MKKENFLVRILKRVASFVFGLLGLSVVGGIEVIFGILFIVLLPATILVVIAGAL